MRNRNGIANGEFSSKEANDGSDTGDSRAVVEDGEMDYSDDPSDEDDDIDYGDNLNDDDDNEELDQVYKEGRENPGNIRLDYYLYDTLSTFPNLETTALMGCKFCQLLFSWVKEVDLPIDNGEVGIELSYHWGKVSSQYPCDLVSRGHQNAYRSKEGSYHVITRDQLVFDKDETLGILALIARFQIFTSPMYTFDASKGLVSVFMVQQ
ncbi:MAG: hypothetical protein Q9160_004847 [Pyrenula sp. 1 TL-2023]